MNTLLCFVSRILLISASSLLLMSCQRNQAEDEKSTMSRVVVAVKTANVVEGDAVLTATMNGRTDALRKEKIFAPIAGTVISLRAFEGTHVRKGDVIVQIASKESRTAILGAEAMLRAASTSAQKTEAEEALALARRTEKVVSIAARFDGYVSTRNISEGELVAENTELLTVIDLSTIEFLADLRLRDLPSIRSGQLAQVTFESLPGKRLPAVVAAISPQSDLQSQTVKVRLQFQSIDRAVRTLLRTDMIGEAHIVTGMRRHALFVPKSAILRNDEGDTYTVITVTPDSLARSVAVVVGVETDSTVEVTSAALHPGTPVITAGNYSLGDSTRVTISRVDSE